LYFLFLRYTDLHPVSLVKSTSRSEIPVSEGGDFNPLYPKDKGFAFEFQFTLRNVTNKRILDTFKNGTVEASADFQPPTLFEFILLKPKSPDDAYAKLILYCTPTAPGQSRLIGSNILVGSADKKKASGILVYAQKIPLFLKHSLGSLFLVRFMQMS